MFAEAELAMEMERASKNDDVARKLDFPSSSQSQSQGASASQGTLLLLMSLPLIHRLKTQLHPSGKRAQAGVHARRVLTRARVCMHMYACAIDCVNAASCKGTLTYPVAEVARAHRVVYIGRGCGARGRNR